MRHGPRGDRAAFRAAAAYRSAATGDLSAEKPAAAGPTTISFNAFSRDFTLELEPNGRLARMQARADGGSAYRGKLAGHADSWVSHRPDARRPHGARVRRRDVVRPGKRCRLDGCGERRARDVSARRRVFRAGRARPRDGRRGHRRQPSRRRLAQEFTALEAAGANLNLDLGAVADFEFSQRFGSNAETAMTRVNNIDGLFSSQVGVQITVGDLDLFLRSASNDLSTSTTVATTLLDEVANYRGATEPPGRARSHALVHGPRPRRLHGRRRVLGSAARAPLAVRHAASARA